jgi:hypothetical protein
MSWRGWLPLSLLVFGFFSFASCPTVCVIIPETVIIELDTPACPGPGFGDRGHQGLPFLWLPCGGPSPGEVLAHDRAGTCGKGPQW